jgi:hypothetical protein
MKNPTRQYPVTLNRGGKDYNGTYQVTGRSSSAMIQVCYGIHSKSTQLGGTEASVLARMILAELVSEAFRG